MISDKQLIQTFIDGDQIAFRSLVLRYQDHMFSVCMSVLKNRDEAQEATQDTFLKVHRAIKSYNSESKFSSWLYKIAYRTSLDYLRKRKSTSDLDSINSGYLGFEDSKSNSLENQELSHLLLKAMDSMPEDESVLIRMFYLEEMSIKELEEITGMGKSNIKVKLFRARKKLSNILSNQYKGIEEYLHH